MSRKTTLLLLLCLLLTIHIHAEKVVITPDEPSDVTYRVVDATDDYTIVEIQINAYNVDTIDIGKDKYLNIGIESAGVTLEKGFPSLPILAKSLIIGHDSQMQIEVLKADYTEFEGQIAPSKGNLKRNVNPADIPYTFDDIYTKDTFYPSEIAILTEPYVMREIRGIAFQILPVIVNPAQQIIRLYHNTTIKVFAEGKTYDETTLPAPTSLITTDFIEIYESHFLNYPFYETRYNSITEQGAILVICYPDFMTAIQPYVAWKRQKGYPTTIIESTTAGTTAAAIKTYISNYYTANPTTAFVQFVGDHPQIPSLIYNNDGAADPNFGMLTGGSSDYYPEILIGRFSAASIADVETQVLRTIQYERDLTTSATWIPRATGIASNEGQGNGHDGGESDQTHVANIRTRLLNYGYDPVDTIYQANGSTASQVSNAFNAGRSYANYTGHGSTTTWVSPSYSNSNVNALTNAS